MLMLYANKILKEIYGENEIYLSSDSLERIIIDKSCIETVATTLNPDFPIVLYVKLNKTGYRIELKPNKNFSTIAGFFEYIRDYGEIVFETKEVPVKKQDVVEDDGMIILKQIRREMSILGETIDRGLYKVNYKIDDLVDNLIDKTCKTQIPAKDIEEFGIKMIQDGDIFYRNKEKVIIIDNYGDESLALVKDHGLVYFKIYHNVDEIFKNYSFVKNDEKLVSNLMECVSETLGKRL